MRALAEQGIESREHRLAMLASMCQQLSMGCDITLQLDGFRLERWIDAFHGLLMWGVVRSFIWH